MIEKVYHAIRNEIENMQVTCDRQTIELIDDFFRVSITKNRGTDLVIDVKKKCSFSGYHETETTFVWHIKTDDDIPGLIARIKKIPASTTKNGPYDFSRRSTYIKKWQQRAFAMSGNFVNQAAVSKIVVLGEMGKVLDNVAAPGGEPWFLIDTGSVNINSTAGMILYNMEQWWPVATERTFRSIHRESEETHKFRATSVLRNTEGKLLTMHDKFVLDLAVKVFNENHPETK